jgi:hypothetical protein
MMFTRRWLLTLIGLAPLAAVAAKMAAPSNAAVAFTENWVWSFGDRLVTAGETVFIRGPATVTIEPVTDKIIPRGEQWEFRPTERGWRLSPVKTIIRS